MGFKRKQVMDDPHCMSVKTPKRKPNWTETEQNRMLDLYANYKELLASKQNTPRHKAECWVSITDKLNEANTSVRRSVDEVKRKWHNLVGQSRRDFYDWKRAQQDTCTKSAPWTMPAKSRKALELFFKCKFEDWKNRGDDLQWDDGSSQEDDEKINFDAETCDEQPPEQPRSAPSDPEVLPASIKVKEEHPGPPSVAGTYELPASDSALQDTGIQQTPQVQHVWSTLPIASTYNCKSTVSASKNSVADDTKVQHDLGTIAASASLNQISLKPLHQPPVITATVHPSSSSVIPSSSSVIDQTSLLASSTLHSHESSPPPPEEPARKKFRESETVQSKREAELRMDILQLEKDKLWLETEKLRLEIDILRKQKQQMDKN